MKSMSLGERILELGKLIISSPLYIGLFLIFFLIMTFLLLNIKKKNKIITYLFLGSILALFAFVLLGYHQSILTQLDNLIGTIVLNVFFPSWIVYFLVIVISYGIIIKTILHKESSKLKSIVNIVVFSILQFLFASFLIVVLSHNLDLSNRISIYTRSELVTILQFSMTLFLIWMLFLAGYRLIQKISHVVDHSSL